MHEGIGMFEQEMVYPLIQNIIALYAVLLRIPFIDHNHVSPLSISQLP